MSGIYPSTIGTTPQSATFSTSSTPFEMMQVFIAEGNFQAALALYPKLTPEQQQNLDYYCAFLTKQQTSLWKADFFQMLEELAEDKFFAGDTKEIYSAALPQAMKLALIECPPTGPILPPEMVCHCLSYCDFHTIKAASQVDELWSCSIQYAVKYKPQTDITQFLERFIGSLHPEKDAELITGLIALKAQYENFKWTYPLSETVWTREAAKCTYAIHKLLVQGKHCLYSPSTPTHSIGDALPSCHFGKTVHSLLCGKDEEWLHFVQNLLKIGDWTAADKAYAFMCSYHMQASRETYILILQALVNNGEWDRLKRKGGSHCLETICLEGVSRFLKANNLPWALECTRCIKFSFARDMGYQSILEHLLKEHAVTNNQIPQIQEILRLMDPENGFFHSTCLDAVKTLLAMQNEREAREVIAWEFIDEVQQIVNLMDPSCNQTNEACFLMVKARVERGDFEEAELAAERVNKFSKACAYEVIIKGLVRGTYITQERIVKIHKLFDLLFDHHLPLFQSTCLHVVDALLATGQIMEAKQIAAAMRPDDAKTNRAWAYIDEAEAAEAHAQQRY